MGVRFSSINDAKAAGLRWFMSKYPDFYEINTGNTAQIIV